MIENKETSEDQDDINLGEQFLKIESLQHRYFGQIRQRRGVSRTPHRGQGRVLALLKLQPEISQKELAFLLDMRPQSVGELLSKLERAALITRVPSEKDKRVMKISLTAEGLLAASNVSDEPTYDEIFNVLNKEEQKQLSIYLEKLINAFEAEVDDNSKGLFDRRGPRPDFAQGGIRRGFQQRQRGEHFFENERFSFERRRNNRKDEE